MLSTASVPAAKVRCDIPLLCRAVQMRRFSPASSVITAMVYPFSVIGIFRQKELDSWRRFPEPVI